MRRTLLVILMSALALSTQIPAQTLAPTPPMGWNSWDAYGLTIDEVQFRANTEVLASLKQYGWQYAVIDEGWYLADPFAQKHSEQKFVYDSNGRLIPATNRFPSSAGNASLKPIADWVHAQGLKFGIHLIRGIPRDSVDRNTPIAGSNFKAQEAADTTDTCPWNEDNYGIRDNAAGQAWYDSMIGLYAGWGVDFLKVDCISSHTYKPSEILQIHRAIEKSGRPIVLSLSPGPTLLEHADVVTQNAQMWRITDDHWDIWSKDKPTDNFPFTTHDAFDRLARWNKYAKPGNWPDDDMLPFGSLTPHPGYQNARESRLTHDEERFEFTLWCFARSPLILGANLTKLDPYLRTLLTNKDLIAASQAADLSQPLDLTQKNLPATFQNIRAWQSASAGTMGSASVSLALFNLGDQPAKLDFTWPQLGLHGTKAKNIFNEGKLSGEKASITLPPHSTTVYTNLTVE